VVSISGYLSNRIGYYAEFVGRVQGLISPTCDSLRSVMYNNNVELKYLHLISELEESIKVLNNQLKEEKDG